MMHMRFESSTTYDLLRGVLAEAKDPLTAREIYLAVETDEQSGSPHRVATILGRQAEAGEIKVIAGNPYRYTLNV